MSDWFSPSALAGGSHLWFIVFVAVGLFLWRLWRNWRLSRIDPPTAEELEEIKQMQRTGSFRVSGRSSAVSRHFGHATKTDSDRNYGGTRNLHEATVVNSWRDDDGD